jgi:hypothetical protein
VLGRARSCDQNVIVRLASLVPADPLPVPSRPASLKMAHVQFANSHDIREDDTMKFATTIRSALSSEPARRWFEGEVGNGFKYLDHALAKVIAGPQEEYVCTQ